MSENYVGIPASEDPADMHVHDWQQVQALHIQGDEPGLMEYVQGLHRRAYQRGHSDGAKKAMAVIEERP